MKNNPILEIKNLDVVYKTLNDQIVALKDINLRVGERESLGIIGESGCGKSTLFYAIMDYLPSNGISSGEILFKGENLLEKSQKEVMEYRGDRIAMVYQNPYSSLNPSLTIGYQLDEVTRFHRGYSRKEARIASIQALTDLYLGDTTGIVRRYPHQISGGMQQRICIAMALLCRPDLLILDEPTTALDVTTEIVILDIIGELKEKYDMSLIYISHDIGVVNKVADRIAVMYRGEIVETGAQNTIFQNPEHPYTRALINCMPRSGIVKEEVRLNTIPGYVARRSAAETGCPYVSRCEKKAPGCETEYGIRESAPNHFSSCNRAYAEDVPDKKRAALKIPIENNGNGKNILAIENLYKYYGRPGRKVRALDGVSVSLDRNSVLGIVGESGCGKSTMGLTISGLLKPTKGKLYFDGIDISISWKKRTPEVFREIQLIFQNPGRSLNPSFNLERIIGRPIKKLLGIKSRAVRRKMIIDILKKVDLGEEYLYRKATQLSGGEMQRAALARAFSISPDLLICDEPTSALDVSVQASVLNLLGDLQQESGAAYIFISHDLNVINYISDYIMVMYLGRICEYGRKEEIVGSPYHPYTEALLSAVPDVDPSLKKKIIRIEGSPPNPTKKIEGCPFADRCHRKIGDICDTVLPTKAVFSDTHYTFCHLTSEEMGSTSL
ncbi:MAG: dipeptide ABC transporter ATP-binding protein [Spirochaetales bacterium]|nr:dipeptide ABC transporter ATP-binding protein [Spirochaetales bacterium]